MSGVSSPRAPSTQRGSAWLATAGSLVWLAACGAEAAGTSLPTAEAVPPHVSSAVSRFALSAATLARLQAADVSSPESEARRLGAALEFLCGTRDAPGYWAPASWRAAGRDSTFAEDELPPETWELIRAENSAHFRTQLLFVERGSYAAAPEPVDAPDVWAAWRVDLAPLLDGVVQGTDVCLDSDVTWHDAAVAHWRDRYPTLADSAALYTSECASCHGDTGAGDGPLGLAVAPRPRDFTLGVFKWSPVTPSGRPRRATLSDTIARGVPGTTMQAFTALTTAQREGLADWVRFLAVRGETERIAAELAAADGALELRHVERAYALVWSRWDEAASSEVSAPGDPPQDLTSPERRARGAARFVSAGAACVTCHGDEGRGDGPAVWEEGPEGRRRRLDSFGLPSRPRDLATEPLHGGDRPEDVFRVIRDGIPGTIMPAVASNLDDDAVWDLVAHVLGLRARTM